MKQREADGLTQHSWRQTPGICGVLGSRVWTKGIVPRVECGKDLHGNGVTSTEQN